MLRLAGSQFRAIHSTSFSTTELLARGFDIDGTADDDTLFGTNTTDRISGLGGNGLVEDQARVNNFSSDAANDDACSFDRRAA